MNEVAGVILMVLTSCGQMENGEPTGLWLEEFSVPHRIFIDAGYEVRIVSPLGGRVPVDERSLAQNTRPADADEALKLLADTGSLADVDPDDYIAVFFPGGHGTMFDMPGSEEVHTVVRSFIESQKPSAFICHGPAALTGVVGSDGESIVKGKKVTGFTNEEEAAVGLTEEMPFLLESRLKELGAGFSGGALFESHVIVDGQLITGQNPASSKEAAEELIQLLEPR